MDLPLPFIYLEMVGRAGPFNLKFFEGEMDLRRVELLASATCPPAGAALDQLP
jgi:hypothetical protein